MQCDICHKSEATVHLTEIIDEQITELHLCEECARQKGAQMEQHFGLADLLAGLADLGQQFEVGAKSETKCPNCGLTYQDFRRIGRLNQVQVVGTNGLFFDQRFRHETPQVSPVIAAQRDEREVMQLVSLHQRHDLESLVQCTEPAGQYDKSG